MSKALDKLKKAVSMKPQRRSIELPNGDDFEWFMTPLTLAERAKAQKQAKSDDATDFALQLLVTKAETKTTRLCSIKVIWQICVTCCQRHSLNR